MKRVMAIALCGLILCVENLYAQDSKCGADMIREMLMARDPNNAALLMHRSHQLSAQAAVYEESMAGAWQKTTNVITIPVVFHVILSSAQINILGGTNGIKDRIISQLNVLNEDFRKLNSDASNVPAAFQPLAASADIQFGLAHRRPDGTGTEGYEIKTTTLNSFSANNNGGSDPKSATTGGLDAWHLSSSTVDYLNIWIVNITESGLLGYAIPPSFVNNGFFQTWETGVVIDFANFGKRANSAQYFSPAWSDLGRTATHEVGHFLELEHTFGKSSACSGAGDDGVSDTPPQSNATYSPSGTTCPQFPLMDACSASGNGVMWMNYMDYVDDKCMYMFTTGQVSRMRAAMTPGKISYSLTQHPELLQWPLSVNEMEISSGMEIFPNPSTGRFSLVFTDAKGLEKITVLNLVGQTVYSVRVNASAATYQIDLSGMTRGVYMVQCSFASGTATKKIVIQ